MASTLDVMDRGEEEYDAMDTGPQRSIDGVDPHCHQKHLQEAQRDDGHDKFFEFGETKNIHLNLDSRAGFLEGYALVEYETCKEAPAAKEKLDKSEILGYSITVEMPIH